MLEGAKQAIRTKVYAPVLGVGKLAVFAVCLSILAFLIAVVK